jgi:chromate transporter
LETTSAALPAADELAPLPSLWRIAATFAEISLTAFGGAQIVRMRRASVRERRWMTEEGFLEMLSVANVVPGPSPINTATLIGLKMRGIPGALVAFLACTFPAFFILLGIAWLLATYPDLKWLHGAVVGCAAAAVGMTVANAIEMSKRFSGKVLELSFLVVTFVTVVYFQVPIYVALLGYVPVSMLIRALVTRRAA